MCILIAFNKRESWTFEELIAETGGISQLERLAYKVSYSDIPEKECSRALMSMILGKAANRVLRKEPKGEIKKTDKIMVNDSFTSKLHKVKILSVTAKTVSKPILTQPYLFYIYGV